MHNGKKKLNLLTAIAIRFCIAFSSSAAFSSSLRTLSMLFLFRTCQLKSIQLCMWPQMQHVQYNNEDKVNVYNKLLQKWINYTLYRIKQIVYQ